MRVLHASARLRIVAPIVPALLLAGTSSMLSQQQTPRDTAKHERFELYGYSQGDLGYDFNQNDPLWFDVVRPSKLPAFENQFGFDGRFWGSVRQSRLGVRTFIPTRKGELRTIFEFDLFGVGAFAGQTTIRSRIFYGEIGQFGAGQYFSPFMDIDVFPNILDYWGPNGMVFFRNIQARWMPIQGKNRLTVALERPGASADQGDFADRIELEDVRGRFPIPDLSAEYRHGTAWGYVELAGILRYLRIDDLVDDAVDLNRGFMGGGGSLSSNFGFNHARDVVRFQITYGSAIENYMNDAPADVGVDETFEDPLRPIRGVGLPVLGLVAFLDHSWNDRFTSSIGYSALNVENSNGQADDAFHRGHYAIANLLYYPIRNMMTGIELQFARRENFADDFGVNDFRIQFSAKYNFSFESSRPAVDDKE